MLDYKTLRSFFSGHLECLHLEPWSAMWEIQPVWGHHAMKEPKLTKRSCGDGEEVSQPAPNCYGRQTLESPAEAPDIVGHR